MESITHYISHYGYFGIFVLLMFGIIGVPVPDETMLAFAGYLVYKGDLKFFPVSAAAWLGSACGITVSFLLGRFVGVGLLKRFGAALHAGPDRMARVHDWFERAGKWSLTFGYFVPGVRHIIAIVAGMSELPPAHFALFAYPGALLWTFTFVTFGYLLADAWKETLAHVHNALFLAVGIAIVASVVYLVVRRLRPRGA